MSAFSKWAKNVGNINWKESVSLSGFARSSQGGDARRLWDKGASTITGIAADNKMDVMGGDVKKLANMAEDAGQRFSKTIHGKWHQDGGGGNTSTDDIAEPGTRATMAGRRNRLDEYSTDKRRGVSRTMVNLNKGKKHTLLTKTKGGR